MYSSELSIKQAIESFFDMPFDVRMNSITAYPQYIINPQNQEEELFDIRISLKNEIRLVMDFQPQRCSADMIRNMSKSTFEKKSIFCKYAKLFQTRKAKISLRINSCDVDPFDFSNWIDEWRSINIRITRTPISDVEEIAFDDIVSEWGILMIGMVLSLLDITTLDELASTGISEGARTTILANRFERSPINRALCLASKGYCCRVCGVDFSQRYGNLGVGYIHVHHVIPVSKMGAGYIVDPINDLEPVCPNCHAMIHKREEPYSIEEIREILIK